MVDTGKRQELFSVHHAENVHIHVTRIEPTKLIKLAKNSAEEDAVKSCRPALSRP